MHPAYFVLVLPPLFWAGNFVVGRDVVQQFDPISFSFWRWQLAWLLMVPFVAGPVWKQRHLIFKHLPILSLLALTSVTAFNTLAYIGLQHTTATNGTLLNSLIPIMIIILLKLFWGASIGVGQLIGVLLSFIGVLVILTQLDIQVLLDLSFNQGDLWVLIAVIDWSFYSIFLRYRPSELSAPVFLASTVTLGMLFLWPLFLFLPGVENISWNSKAYWSVGYVALFPSLLAYLGWNYGIKHLGADVAGQYTHLMPFFGAALAILFLGEKLQAYHLLGGILIGIGIWLTIAHKQFASNSKAST